MRVLVIRIDGREETHEVMPQTVLMEIYQLIGCDTVDTVNLRDGQLMLVDDNGYVFDKPVNPKATALYHAVCVPGTTHAIVGDVAIVRDEDFR